MEFPLSQDETCIWRPRKAGHQRRVLCKLITGICLHGVVLGMTAQQRGDS